MIVDEVTQLILDLFGHNDRGRVRTVLNSMNVLMLRAPGQSSHHTANLAPLYDDVQATRDTEVRLWQFIERARMLPNNELPLEVPLVFFSGRLCVHPHGVAGSFDYVREENRPDGTTRLPYGQDRGMQILEPVPIPFPPLPPPPQPNPPTQPIPPAAGNAGAAAPQPDPHAAINNAMDAVRAMTQAMVEMNIAADARSAAMARQQMDLQAATLRSNAQQIGQLTATMGNLGNLGHDVGRAIASHPPPTIQATLSHSSVTPGQSMNPRDMG